MLSAAYDEAITDGPTVALVAGEAGIGKSRLVAEFTSRLDGKARVLVGGCLELGAEGLPYAPFVTITRLLVRELGADWVTASVPGQGRSLAHWLPELGDVGDGPARHGDGPDQGRARLFEEILSLVERAAAERPLVCVLEDLHWADASSRDLLVFLARNLTQPGVLVIGSYRLEELEGPQPLRPLLAELGRARRVHLVEPAPFSRVEVGRQLGGILGHEPEPVLVTRVHERSDGNPLFIEALAEAGETTPSSLRDLLLAGLSEMSDRTRRVVRIASVAGTEFGHPLLAAVSGLDDVELESALRHIVDRRLLVPTDRGYAFRHALIRTTVYEDLLPGERVRLHARCAEALVAQRSLVPEGRAPAELAAHWFAAGDHERALDAAWQAAEAARVSYAYDEQARLLRRVLDLWNSVDDPSGRLGVDHAAVVETAAQACFASGDAERGLALASAALDEIDASREPERAAHALFTRSWLRSRIDAGGEDDLEAALRLLPSDPPSVTRGRILAGLAGHFLTQANPHRARGPAEEALEVARRTGDVDLTAWALMDLGFVIGLEGDLESGLEMLSEAREAARRDANDYVLLTAMLWEAALFGMSGDHERQLAVARDGLAVARAVGLHRNRGTILASNVASALFESGRWQEARDVLDDALAADPPPVYRATLTILLGELALAEGHVAAAVDAVAAVEALVPRGTWVDRFLHHRYALQCRLAVAQGEPERADQILDRALAENPFELHELYAWSILMAGAEVQRARMARVVRDPETKRRIVRRQGEVRALCDKATVTWPWGAACRATFLAELSDGDLAAWDEAATAWRDLRTPYQLAQSLLGGAEAALAGGDRAGAEERLREADTIAIEVGAVPLARKIDQLAARGRLNLRGAEPASTAAAADEPNPLGLTRRELDVLRLVAEGRSNRQIGEALFISPNTAGVHVSNILTKLGVASRIEAAAIAHRSGLLDGSDG